MEKCRKCGNDYDPESLPPSLREKLKRCRKCYNATKRKSDALWLLSQGLTKSEYQKQKKDRNARKNWEGVK